MNESSDPQHVPIVQRLAKVFRLVHLAYLRWELTKVLAARRSIPHERVSLRRAEYRRQGRRLDDIANESARRLLEAQCRIDELQTAILHIEGNKT